MSGNYLSRMSPRKGRFLLPALILLVSGSAVAAQAPGVNPPVQGAQQTGMSSVATGAAHAAVLDAQHRPITAGGFVKSGPIVYEDIAKRPGLLSGRTRWARPPSG